MTFSGMNLNHHALVDDISLVFLMQLVISYAQQEEPNLSHAANISLTITMTHRWFQTGVKSSKHTCLYSHTHTHD